MHKDRAKLKPGADAGFLTSRLIGKQAEGGIEMWLELATPYEVLGHYKVSWSAISDEVEYPFYVVGVN